MTPALPTFEPQADITAFELAGCMDTLRSVFTKEIIDKETFELLPPGVQRHFIITELDAPPPEEF